MNDMLLAGAIKAQNFAEDMTSRAFRAARNEKGDVVQTIIIIGIFLVICVVVGGMIMAAMETQGKKLSDCISNVNNADGCNQFGK